MNEQRICSRCVLPERKPELHLDERGICNVCLAYERAQQSSKKSRPPVETDFVRLLKKYRKKGPYDCLVMCSGGKDSTASLYYMVRRYKARVLAFTFDHGFETAGALDNVRRAVEQLDVDYMTFRSTFMHDMFARILKSGSPAVLCHVCSIWYMDLTYRMAARFKIPIIIAGWTKGQTSDPAEAEHAYDTQAPEFAAMGRATAAFLASLKGDPQYGDFPRTMDEVMKRARKRHKSVVLSPHWFLPYDTETYVETIQRELGWDYPEQSYPGRSTNCALNYVSVQKSLENFGFTHYHVEMSKLIRRGMMSREEALELLHADFDKDMLNQIAEPLDFRFE